MASPSPVSLDTLGDRANGHRGCLCLFAVIPLPNPIRGRHMGAIFDADTHGLTPVALSLYCPFRQAAL
jgi:hypothetical protein